MQSILNNALFNETPNGVLTTFTVNTSLTLDSVDQIHHNDGSLSPSSYTFTSPNTVEFTSAPATGDTLWGDYFYDSSTGTPSTTTGDVPYRIRARLLDKWMSAKTKLTAEVAVGGTALTTKNNSEFETDNKVLLSTYGKEVCEMRTASDVNADKVSITIDACVRKHRAYANVQSLKFDQIGLFGSDTSQTSWIQIGSYEDLIVDQPQGNELIDSTASYAYYKVRYKNSTTAVESDLDDSKTYASDYDWYCTLQQVKHEAGFDGNENISEEEVQKHRNSAKMTVDSYLNKVYTLPLTSVPENVSAWTYTLGAAYLLREEYGASDPEAKAKEEAVLSQMQEMVDKNILLVDASGAELPTSGLSATSGWPNETTADATLENAGGDYLMRISEPL